MFCLGIQTHPHTRKRRSCPLGMAWFVSCRTLVWHLLGLLSSPPLEHDLQNNLSQHTFSKVRLFHLYFTTQLIILWLSSHYNKEYVFVCAFEFGRYESRLPGVDIFVFTADAAVEPPLLVINTVLSLMAYDYPPQKLSVYLSDDGGSEITFYALLEASSFAKHWVPFCKIFKVEPRSPAAFFNNPASTKSEDHNYVKHLATIHVCNCSSSLLFVLSSRIFKTLYIPSHKDIYLRFICRNCMKR